LESAKWLGKCPGCNEWNSFYEEKLSKNTSSSKTDKSKTGKPMALNSVVQSETIRISTGYTELDRVLGGGIVKGSLILLRRRTWYRKINNDSSNL
jgi:DNA repair protein RadA/Sms